MTDLYLLHRGDKFIHNDKIYEIEKHDLFATIAVDNKGNTKTFSCFEKVKSI